MKNLMMKTIYTEIDKAKTNKHLSKIEGMLEMFFLHINTQGITYDNYMELCGARDRKAREIHSGAYVKHL